MAESQSEGMIERVAKAMHEKMCEQDIHGYLDSDIDAAELSRAAIEAMRELPAGHRILMEGKTTRVFWQRAIDAALEEQA